MKPSEMEHLKEKLENLRQESMRFLDRLKNESRSLDADTTQDSADRCVANLSKESLFEQSSQRRTILRLIEAAQQRMTKGSFGICVACGDEIQPRRLQAVPWTQFCLSCQEELEDEVGASVAARTSQPIASHWRRAG
jgi:RNA polymerase-binding transcription factor